MINPVEQAIEVLPIRELFVVKVGMIHNLSAPEESSSVVEENRPNHCHQLIAAKVFGDASRCYDPPGVENRAGT